MHHLIPTYSVTVTNDNINVAVTHKHMLMHKATKKKKQLLHRDRRMQHETDEKLIPLKCLLYLEREVKSVWQSESLIHHNFILFILSEMIPQMLLSSIILQHRSKSPLTVHCLQHLLFYLYFYFCTWHLVPSDRAHSHSSLKKGWRQSNRPSDF